MSKTKNYAAKPLRRDALIIRTDDEGAPRHSTHCRLSDLFSENEIIFFGIFLLLTIKRRTSMPPQLLLFVLCNIR